MNPSRLARRLGPLRIHDYRWYITATVMVGLGLEIQGAALFWQVYQLTHSTVLVGMIGLAEVVPVMGLSLIAGSITDRTDRRRLVALSTSAFVACALGLWTCALVPQHAALQWTLFSLTALGGAARSFFLPARSALGAELVPREQFSEAVSLRSAARQLAAVVGPGIGGVLIAVCHGALWLAYGTEAVLMLGGLGATVLVRHRCAPHAQLREPWRRSFQDGLRFVWRDPTLLGAMSLDLFAVLFGGAVAMLPAYAHSVLKVGPGAYGLLRSGQSIGAILTWIGMSAAPTIQRSGVVMLWAVTGFGVCWMVVSYSPFFLLTLAMLIIAGGLDYLSVVVRTTLIQMRTPVMMLGRVTAVSAIFVGSSNELGGFESGVMAEAMGLQRSVLLGGGLTVLVVALTTVLCPSLARLGPIDRLEVSAQAKALAPAPSPPGPA